jgi:hypothetical protein
MVPTTFISIPAVPQNAAGKVRREALPNPEPPPSAGSARPTTDLERMIEKIWCSVLELDSVGVDDGFFDMGGNSLLASKVMARLGRALGKMLSIRLVFEAPTIREMARRLAS